MRRTTIIFSTALMLLAIGPASALARHGHRGHHARAHHAHIERFGHDQGTATRSEAAGTAGTVKSFDGGVLTMLLNDGSTVSGSVTAASDLECMAPAAARMDRDGGSGDGDHSGSGDDQAQSSGDSSSEDGHNNAAEQNDDAAEEPNDPANDNNDDNNDDNENAGANCSTSSLTPGTVVREAVLRVAGSGNTWTKVELGS